MGGCPLDHGQDACRPDGGILRGRLPASAAFSLRRVGSGVHRRVAGAAAVSGAVGSQNYEITLRAVSLAGG
jgi:hypothetical protein